jgi:hypothetical protein
MVELHGQRCNDALFATTKDCGFTVSQSSGEYVVFTKKEALRKTA